MRVSVRATTDTINLGVLHKTSWKLPKLHLGFILGKTDKRMPLPDGHACQSNRRNENAPMTKRTKIAFVSRKWPPAMGGMETYSLKLSEALRSYCDVETLYLPGQKDGGVPSAGKLIVFGVMTALKLIFTRHPAQITHVADMASWPLALCARLRSPRSHRVLSAHGTDVSYPLRGGLKGTLYGAYLRLGARLLGHVGVVANSSATADAVRAYGYNTTHVVPLASDGRGEPVAKPKPAVLFSGRLVQRKGCAWFINNVLPKLPPEVTLDVAGTVWDAEERNALDEARVRYLGKLDQDALWQAYANALCVVVPNIDVPNGEFEGFGLVALEAAAAGGVVLASHHSGLKEAVIDEKTGFHLAPGDTAAWVEKIEEIANWTDTARLQFTTNAQKTCFAYYTWDRVARDTMAAYDVAMESKAA